MRELVYLTLLELPGVWLRSAARLTEAWLRHTPKGDSIPDTLSAVLPPESKAGRIDPAEIDAAQKRALLTQEKMKKLGVRLVFLGEPGYPPLLGRAKDAPAALFIRGSDEALRAPKAVAIVGTREPSRYGSRCARKISETLARGGWCVVSGLAAGIDAEAHQGALEGGGKTVAVLAHGLDRVYPRAHDKLAEEIVLKSGALVSEYPPGAPPARGQFVERDRIQSGLALATLLIESDLDGGAMHTARFAREQGRAVYAMVNPNSPDAPQARGPKELISKGQAIGVEDASLYGLLKSLAGDPSPVKEPAGSP